jgi:hypothetical protein
VLHIATRNPKTTEKSRYTIVSAHSERALILRRMKSKRALPFIICPYGLKDRENNVFYGAAISAALNRARREFIHVHSPS